MASFTTTPAARPPDSALRLPASKRISAPTAYRLSTITEGSRNATAAPAIPPTSTLRRSTPPPARSLTPTPPGRSRRRSRETQKTAPPAYSWVPEPIEDEGYAPVEGEKLHNLRKGRDTPRRKGGWGRLAAIVAIVLLVIALAVGLSVGLTVGKRKPNNAMETSSQPAGSGPDTSQPQAQPFPLGEYSFVTALHAQSTNCTSNPATWRCYPYTTLNASDSSTTSTSLATFNWVLSNTSSTYATYTNTTTAPTPAEGVVANLTISSTDKPFSIAFSAQPLTYLSTPDNATSPRYTFTFAMSKAVIPSTSITSSGAVAECFFNATTFTATIYLSASRDYPSGELAASTGVGGYAQWPFAVEISQTQAGGARVPDCYEYVNGNVGARILTGLDAVPPDQECACEYRNY